MLFSASLTPRLMLIALLILVCGAGAATAGDIPSTAAAGNRSSAMTLGQAALLGVVEGLTEYLPVSSTGHLLLAERIMGIGDSASATAEQKQRTKEAVDAYTICIQAGAIIAVLGLYFRRVKQMVQGLTGTDRAGRQMLVNVVAGFLPAAVFGLLLNKVIKAYLFGPWPVVAAWLAGGLAILAVSWWRPRNSQPGSWALPLDDLTWKMALIIGFTQCIAMWPGVSRSLVTIVGGLLVGLSLAAAVEFSFLLGVVTLGAATAYDAIKHGRVMLQTFDSLSLALGLMLAFISAVVSVKWMVAYLNRHGLEVFGYYRVALALVTALLIVTNTI